VISILRFFAVPLLHGKAASNEYVVFGNCFQVVSVCLLRGRPFDRMYFYGSYKAASMRKRTIIATGFWSWPTEKGARSRAKRYLHQDSWPWAATTNLQSLIGPLGEFLMFSAASFGNIFEGASMVKRAEPRKRPAHE